MISDYLKYTYNNLSYPMDSIKEAYLSAFYSHESQVESKCNLQCPSEELIRVSNHIISYLIEVDCQEIIKIIKDKGGDFGILPGDVPQFSSFNDCVYKVPILVRDCGLEDLTYTRLGFMLRTKPRKDGADMKYGENHSKTAAQMGLCSITNSRISPSYLGLSFCNLDRATQSKLLPKLILFIPYIQNQFASGASYEEILGSVSFLSESTQKRRLSNIWYLITEVNKVLPYELQIIRY